MKYSLRFHELVSEDIRKAINWYESQREGLGNEFDFELTEGVKGLGQAPLSHGFAFAGIRFKCLHRFPYVIYFVIEKSEVRVLAVLHGRQDNNIVKERQQYWPS